MWESLVVRRFLPLSPSLAWRSLLYRGWPRWHLWPGLLKFYAPRDKTYWLLLIAAISRTLQLLDWAITGPLVTGSNRVAAAASAVLLLAAAPRRLIIARRLPLSDFIPTIARNFPVARRYLLSITLNTPPFCLQSLTRSLLSDRYKRFYRREPQLASRKGNPRAHFP